MRFQICGDESESEEKLKEDLNSLFFVEEQELIEVAWPYFLIRRNGGIVSSERRREAIWERNEYFVIDEERIPAEKIEYLIDKKVIGRRNSIFQPGKVFLFDNFDARFNEALKHPLGIEIYYELKEMIERPEYILTLLRKTLSNYNKLRDKIRGARKKILATAIILACRKEYPYSVNLKKYFRLAGTLSMVLEAGEKIGESIRYDPDARMRAYVSKFKLKKASRRKFMELWKKEREKFPSIPVTPSYIAALVYLASKLANEPITQKEVAERMNVVESSIRRHTRKLAIRQGLSFVPLFSRRELQEMEEELRKELNLPPTFRIKNYSVLSLHKTRLKIAEYLLKNNHDEENPITRIELMNKLNLSKWELHYALGSRLGKRFMPYISVGNAGVHCNGVVYIEDVEKLRKYVKLMRKLVGKLKNLI